MIILIVIAVLASEAQAITTICLLDSGVTKESNAVMCDGYDDEDAIGHGTKIAKVIASYAGNNYCIKSYKLFINKKNFLSVPEVLDIVSGCDVINLSIDSDVVFNHAEYKSLYYAAKSSKIFLAAGNKGIDLDKKLLYPVGYKLIPWTVIGNVSSSSNYGSAVNQLEDYCVKDFCGTSVSVAIATGKYVGGL